MFGRMLKDWKHAAVIFGVMLVLSAGTVVWAVYFDSMQPNPALTGGCTADFFHQTPQGVLDLPAVAGLPVDQSLGNLEGKELRFGTLAGPTWAAFTTNTSNGSVNSMHDSLNPLAGLTPLAGMWLNCIWGGVGVGFINFFIYLIVGVFLAGLMVGRTPEYLGKKVEAREMKLASLALLIHPLMILGPTGLFAACDWGSKSTNNPAAHGFSEILYEFTSASANNGSGFEGLADTWGFNDPAANPVPPAPYSPQWDIACGLVMLISRFIPIWRRWRLPAVWRPRSGRLSRSAPCAPIPSPSVSFCSAPSCWLAPCCSSPPRCSAPSRSTWARCHLAGENLACGFARRAKRQALQTTFEVSNDAYGLHRSAYRGPLPDELKLARRASRRAGLFAPELLKTAFRQSFIMLRPDIQWKNPVMFVVEVGTILTFCSPSRPCSGTAAAPFRLPIWSSWTSGCS